jgi:hypothetical protein
MYDVKGLVCDLCSKTTCQYVQTISHFGSLSSCISQLGVIAGTMTEEVFYSNKQQEMSLSSGYVLFVF